MEIAFTVANSLLSVLLLSIAGVWIYFLGYMTKSFKLAPRLDLFDKAVDTAQLPKVSVILPARNEEHYISRCLDSLLAQNYPNFEIVAINDSSTDRTGEIIRQYASRDNRVMHLDAPPKPEGWAGKNWACYEGYLNSKGDLLLFTDADTEHSPAVISLAVRQMITLNLDALSAVPRLICNDFWTKITLPALAIFLHTRFSPLRVNDPKSNTGYFFGSFFIIKRETYKAVGTHKGVRQELVEDGALGGIVKEGKFKMRMVRGEDQIKAIWARDLSTLWHGLRRLMIPLYHQNKKGAYLMVAAVFFILFAPFLILPYITFARLSHDSSFQILLVIEMATIALIFTTTALQCNKGVFESPIYAIAAPLSGALVSFGFATAIADAKKRDAVSWRDRQYTISKDQHPIH